MFLFIGGELLRAALRVTLQAGPRMHGDFDSCLLIRDVYIRLATLCPHPRQIFLSLPGCTEEMLREFEARLSATKERAQRAVFRDFLNDLELTEETRRRKLKSVPTLCPAQFNSFAEVLQQRKKIGRASRRERVYGDV